MSLYTVGLVVGSIAFISYNIYQLYSHEKQFDNLRTVAEYVLQICDDRYPLSAKYDLESCLNNLKMRIVKTSSISTTDATEKTLDEHLKQAEAEIRRTAKTDGVYAYFSNNTFNKSVILFSHSQTQIQLLIAQICSLKLPTPDKRLYFVSLEKRGECSYFVENCID